MRANSVSIYRLNKKKSDDDNENKIDRYFSPFLKNQSK